MNSDFRFKNKEAFQLGCVVPDVFPPEVWVQVQPGDPKHDAFVCLMFMT